MTTAPLTALLLLATAAAADGDYRVDGEVRFAADEDGTAHRYFRISPEYRRRLARDLDVRVGLRMEAATGRTGLGRTDGFADAEAPVEIGDAVRIEIDQAAIEARLGGSRLTLGKQTVAWGVLDGIRITDGFNPQRLTEWVAREPRPDRIPIWAGRLRGEALGWSYDIAAAPFSSLSQIAEPGDVFDPTAERFRAGLPETSHTADLARDERAWFADEPRLGARFGRSFGRTQIHVSALAGTQHEGVIGVAEGQARLLHRRATTYGLDAVRPLGPIVLRAEAAYTPDHPVNLENSLLPTIDETGRWVAGLGADWYAMGQTFFTVQVIVDQLTEDIGAVRPQQDVISTFRVRRSFGIDRWRFMAESLHTHGTGDGVVRTEIVRRVGDPVELALGADVFYGSPDGLFGQFEEASRLNLSVRFAL